MDLKGNVFTFKIKKRFQFISENKFHLKRGGISSREKAENFLMLKLPENCYKTLLSATVSTEFISTISHLNYLM